MSNLDYVLNIQPRLSDDNERLVTSKTSIMRVLFLFYLFTAHGYCQNLMGKPLQRYIKDNRIIQHLIGFLVIFTLITFDSTISIRDAIIYAAIGYMWFIFSTKLDGHWNIILLTLLFAGFVLDSHLRNKEKEIRTDPNVSDEQIIEITRTNNSYRMYLASTAILVTIMGTILYSNRKSEQYGGSYDAFTYLFY